MAPRKRAIDVLARNVSAIVSRERFRSQKIQILYSCGFQLLGNDRPVWRDDWNDLVAACVDERTPELYARYVRELVMTRDLKSHPLTG
jgi:hypothetical protein